MTMTRPSNITYASVLALTSLFIGPIKVFITISEIDELKVALVVLGIFIFLTSVLIFFLWRGVNWCRYLFSGFVVIGLIPFFQIINQDFSISIFIGALSVVQAVLQVWAVVFLHLPNSNVWYSEIKASKNA